MRILLTGGCGFIGRHLLRIALTHGAEVVNLDALTYAARPDLLADVAGHPGYTFVHGDVADQTLLAELLDGVDAVAHLAAETHVDRAITDAGPFLATNVTGTATLLGQAQRSGVPRFLLASTDEVYGSVAAPRRAIERDPLTPSNPYAASKAAGELFAVAARKTYGYPVMITRGCNVLGPGQHEEKAVVRFCTALLSGGDVPLYGSGEHERDWLAVSDHAAALWRVLTAGEPAATYNIAGVRRLANRDLAAAITGLLGLDHTRIATVADRPGHDLRYAVDDSRLRDELGWSPKESFADALAATLAWCATTSR